MTPKRFKGSSETRLRGLDGSSCVKFEIADMGRLVLMTREVPKDDPKVGRMQPSSALGRCISKFE